MTLHFPFARFMSFELPLRIPAAACGGVLLCSTWLLCFAATAADVTEKPKQEKAQTAPSAIPLPQVAEEAEATTIALRKISADSVARKELTAIEAALPALGREVEARGRENRSILAQRPSLELLRDLDARWQSLRDRLAATEEQLQHLIAMLDQRLKQLDDVEKRWAATAAAATDEKAPAEIVQRIGALLGEATAARKQIEARRTAALKLQTRVSDLEVRVTEALATNRDVRDATVERMLARDGEPLWNKSWRDHAAARIATGAGETLEAQWLLLRNYLAAQGSRTGFQAGLFLALAALFYWVRGCLTALVEQEPALRRAATVVEYPIASALVIALMLNHWLYPQAPRLLWAITGIAILVPTILMLRRLVACELLPSLYAVLAFYLVDQIRAVSASIDLVPRLLFVAEMAGAAVLFLWFGYRSRPSDFAPRRSASIVRPLARIGCLICASTALINAAGYVALSNLIGDALLKSMYAGLVLYTVVQILDALVEIAMRARPLSGLNMVRMHRASMQRKVRLAMLWVAAVIWVLHVLDLLAVRERVVDAFRAVLEATMTIGQIEISLASVISFVLAVWAAFLVSRLVRFVLNEEVFPHASLKRGIPYAISRTVHFAIIAIGFVIAMGIVGMEMTQFTILASAFTIGVGFGLQNIFNNFVSGLIVLFERPVQVGDVIQVDDAVGVVERIGIRASVVSTASGSEVIVPNGKLISDRVINWTLSGRRRLIDLPISVVLQSDPQKVINILEEVAKGHAAVLQEPPAQAIVTRLGPDWMGFELRAAVGDVEHWMKVRSELAVAAAAALRAAEITLR